MTEAFHVVMEREANKFRPCNSYSKEIPLKHLRPYIRVKLDD
jgi:hypothetical protein